MNVINNTFNGVTYPVVIQTQQQADLFDKLMRRIRRVLDPSYKEALKEQDGDLFLSYSSLSKFMSSPLTFIYYKCVKPTLEKTETETLAMLEGNLLNTLILEPEKWDERYVEAKEGIELATNAKQKAFLEALAKLNSQNSEDIIQAYFEAGYAGSKVKDIDKKVAADLKSAKAIRDKYIDHFNLLVGIGDRQLINAGLAIKARTWDKLLRTNQASKRLIEGFTVTEKALVWEDEITGLKFRGYMDGAGSTPLIPSYELDLKKMPSANREVLRKKTKWEGWAIQAYLYKQALKSFGVPYFIMGLGTDYTACVRRVQDDELRDAEQRVNWTLGHFMSCVMQTAEGDYSCWHKSTDFYAEVRESPFATLGIFDY